MRFPSLRSSPALAVALVVLAATVAGTSWAIGAGDAPRAAPKGKPKHYALNVSAPVTSTATLSRTVPRRRTFLLYDIVFQNPASDIGRVRLLRGGTTLLELALQNFRLEHVSLQAPIAFRRRQQIRIFIDCDNASGGCTPAALLSGVLRR